MTVILFAAQFGICIEKAISDLLSKFRLPRPFDFAEDNSTVHDFGVVNIFSIEVLCKSAYRYVVSVKLL